MTFFDVYALIMLFTFLTLLISKTVLTTLKGKKTIALTKGKKGLARKIEFAYFIGFFLLLLLVIQGAFDLKLPFIGSLIVLFDTMFTAIIGSLFLTLAIILFSFSLAAFKDAWRIGIDYHGTDTLITTGIFKYSRNPTYLAIILLFIGYFLLYANFFFLGATLFITCTFRFQIKKEEALLEQLFFEDYVLYAKKTPRFFNLFYLFTNKKYP